MLVTDSQNIQSKPIRIETFLGEASDWSASANWSSKADRESLHHIGWLYDNIKIILYIMNNLSRSPARLFEK